MTRKPKTPKPTKAESKAAFDAQAPAKRGRPAKNESQALQTMRSDTKPAFRPQAVPLNKYLDSELHFEPAEKVAGRPCFISGSRIQKDALENNEGRIYFELRFLDDLQNPIMVSLALFNSRGEIRADRMTIHNQVSAVADKGGCIGPVVLEKVEFETKDAQGRKTPAHTFNFEPVGDGNEPF